MATAWTTAVCIITPSGAGDQWICASGDPIHTVAAIPAVIDSSTAEVPLPESGLHGQSASLMSKADAFSRGGIIRLYQPASTMGAL